MSTQTLEQGAQLLAASVLIDRLQVLNVGEPQTVGFEVTRELTLAGDPVSGLVQSVTLENAVEGRVSQAYSIKVPQGTAISEGQAVKVLVCRQEPALVGMVLLLDTVSRNGLSMIRKCTASVARTVDQQGKEATLNA
ncbi:hypothetical protein SEA_JUICER_11 [Microbacterium phage Juicer]|nr:hypothetical protein SEA_JUICER_11 [Microbacterium phage Juicer]